MWRNPAPEDASRFERRDAVDFGTTAEHGLTVDFRTLPFTFGLRGGLRDRYSSLPLAPAPGTVSQEDPSQRVLDGPRHAIMPTPTRTPLVIPPLPLGNPAIEQMLENGTLMGIDGLRNPYNWTNDVQGTIPALPPPPQDPVERYEDAQAPPDLPSEAEGDAAEYDTYTQDDTMSETSESRATTTHRLPLADFNAHPDDLALAKKELLETGLDVDAIDAMADKIRQLGSGLLAELDRISFTLGNVKESSVAYQQALKPIQRALGNRELLSEVHAEALLKSEEGLLDAIEALQSESSEASHANDVINAKMCLVQQLGRAMGETSGIPLCSICYVKPIAVAAKPCGHTYCAGCASKMLAKRRKTCYICTQNCSGSMPLHFP